MSSSEDEVRGTSAALGLASEDIGVGATAPHGRVGGALTVDPDGVASYRIPLELPPGRNGLQPTLALNYSSRRGQTVLGTGFALEGLPRVERCHRTIAANDPQRQGNQAEDGYCFDGKWLVEIGNHADGIEYRTLPDVHAEIVRLSVGPHWRARTSDGLIYYFGSSATSRVAAELPSTSFDDIIAWDVDRIEDRFGNYITASYVHFYATDGQSPRGLVHLLSGLQYTGHTTTDVPMREVNFIHVTRPDVSEVWSRGVRLLVRDRLSRIQVRAPDGATRATAGDPNANVRMVREYQFDYVGGVPAPSFESRSRLSALRDCAVLSFDGPDPDTDPDRVCKPPVVFRWSERRHEIVDQSLTSGDLDAALVDYGVQDWRSTNLVYGDIDGRPGQEMIHYHKVPPPGGGEFGDTTVVVTAFAEGASMVTETNQQIIDNLNLHTDYDRDIRTIPPLLDINLDGRAELVHFQQASFENPAADPTIRLVYNEYDVGTGTFETAQDTGFTLPHEGGPIVFRHFQDENGDGYPDLLTCAPVGPYEFPAVNDMRWNIHHFDPGAHTFQAAAEVTPLPCPDPGPREPGAELSPVAQLMYDAFAARWFTAGPRFPVIQDWDGDGELEWLHMFVPPGGSMVVPGIYEHDEAGVWGTPTLLPFDPEDLVAFKVGDVNGDGLPDLVTMADSTLSTYSYPGPPGSPIVSYEGRWGPALVHVNTGNGFASARPVGLGNIPIREQDFKAAIMEDINRDGRSDLVLPLSLTSSAPVIAEDPQSIRWVVALSTGREFQVAASLAIPEANLVPLWEGPFFDKADALGLPPDVTSPLIPDANGDGYLDIVLLDTVDDDDFAASFYYLGSDYGYQPWLLTYVGEGNVVAGQYDWALEIEYGPLNDDINYTRAPPAGTSGCDAIVDCLRVGRSLVTHTWMTTAREEDGAVVDHLIEPHTETRYRYGGGRFDRLTRSFLGHSSTTTWAEKRGVLEETKYDPARQRLHHRFPFARQEISRVRTTYRGVTSGGEPIAALEERRESIISTPEIVDLGNRHFVFSSGQTIDVSDMGTPVYHQTIERDVDQHANTTFQRTELDAQHYSTVTTVYDAHPTHFQNHLPSHVTITSHAVDSLGARSQQARREFEYDTIAGGAGVELIEERSFPDGDTTLALTTAYSRDEYGNLEQLSQSDGTTTRDWQIDYLDFERDFPSAIRTPLLSRLGARLEHKYAYHPLFGIPWGVEDPNHALTLSKYDGFGRLTSQRRSGSGGTDIEIEAGVVFPSVHVIGSDGSEQRTSYDALGRVTAAGNRRRLDGEWVVGRQQYDAATGALRARTIPVAAGAPEEAITYEYVDPTELGPGGQEALGLGRPRRVVQPDGGTTTFAFYGLVSAVTDPDGNTTSLERNMRGELRELLEIDATTRYEYGPFGQLTHVVDENGNVSRFSRDAYGRLVETFDEDRGTFNYSYDAFGNSRVVEHIESSQETEWEYDELDRVVERSDRVGSATEVSGWEWDTAPNGRLALARSASSDGIAQDYEYDTWGRLAATITSSPSTTDVRTEILQRDSIGRVTRVAMPDSPTGSNVHYTYDYDEFGSLEMLGFSYECDPVLGGTSWACASDTEVWRATAPDESGRLIEEVYGNGTALRRTFNPQTGRLEGLELPSGHHQEFRYTSGGDVRARSQFSSAGWRTEWLEYDAHHRIASSTTRSGPIDTPTAPIIETSTLDYDSIGNLTHRGTEELKYEFAAPHAVSALLPSLPPGTIGYDARGNQIARGDQERSFNPRNQLEWIERTGGGGTDRHDFRYGASGDLAESSVIRGDGSQLSVFRAHASFDLETRADPVPEQTHVYRMPVEGRTVAQVRWGEADEFPTFVYLESDHLGSATATLDDSGGLIERRGYDMFGGARDPDWDAAPSPMSSYHDTPGFTGHRVGPEEELGVMLTGARLYDPKLAQFASPDPIVNPYSSQDLNGYGYAWNNPLRIVDPTGMWEGEYGADAVVPPPVHAWPVPASGSGIRFIGLDWVQDQWHPEGAYVPTYEIEIVYTPTENVATAAPVAAGGPVGTQDPEAAHLVNVAEVTTVRTLLGIPGLLVGLDSNGRRDYLRSAAASATSLQSFGALGLAADQVLVHGFGVEGWNVADAVLGNADYDRTSIASAIGAFDGPAVRDLGVSIGAAAAGTGLTAGSRVNMPAWRRIAIDMDEVASGHMAGGRRLNPGHNKDVFPTGMTETQVERAIRHAYRYGEVLQSQAERVFVRGPFGSGSIEMWVNRTTKMIETAWPKL